MARSPVHRYYREPNTSIEGSTLVRPALLLIEGEITDSRGAIVNYTRDLIDAIVANSNEYLKANEIKLFNDHEYSQKSRIGSVTGQFSAREITGFDTENADLISKYAIFNDGLEVRCEKAIAQYGKGLLKELSCGIILGDRNIIIEVSAVPFPAVDGARLYSQEGKDDEVNQYTLFTFDSQMKRIAEPMDDATYKKMGDIDTGLRAFSYAMDNINQADDNELPKSRYKCVKNAVGDLSSYLMGVCAPMADPEPEGIPITIQQSKNMTEETKTYSAADYAKLVAERDEAQNDRDKAQTLSRDTLAFAQYAKRGSDLVKEGKLEPAVYESYFGGEGDTGLKKYQAALTGNPFDIAFEVLSNNKKDPRLEPSKYGAEPLPTGDVPSRDKKVDLADWAKSVNVRNIPA